LVYLLDPAHIVSETSLTTEMPNSASQLLAQGAGWFIVFFLSSKAVIKKWNLGVIIFHCESTVELQYKEHSLLLNFSTKNTVYCWTPVQRTQFTVELQYKEHSLLLNSSTKSTVYCWTPV